MFGADLLVIDDLSNETENKMTTDKIFELITTGMNRGAGTIITSNLNLTDFDGTVGQGSSAGWVREQRSCVWKESALTGRRRGRGMA